MAAAEISATIRRRYLALTALVLEENRGNQGLYDQLLDCSLMESFVRALLAGMTPETPDATIRSHLHVLALLAIHGGREDISASPTLLSALLRSRPEGASPGLLKEAICVLLGVLIGLPRLGSGSRSLALVLLLAILEHPDTKLAAGHVLKQVLDGFVGGLVAISRGWMRDPAALPSLILCFRLCMLGVPVLAQAGMPRAALGFVEEIVTSTSLFPQAYLAMCVLLRELPQTPAAELDRDFVVTLGKMFVANVTVARDCYQHYLLKALIQQVMLQCTAMDQDEKTVFLGG